MRNGTANGIKLLLMTALLAACTDPSSGTSAEPPFIITKPVFEIIERPGYFVYAGLTFKFLNKSEKDVSGITASFMLFDAQTLLSPFIGSNRFRITKMDTVAPRENKEIIISIDPYIYSAPAEPYIIDFFYVYEIQYTDGSVWQDKKGKYSPR